jgi:hypothetical protein
MITCRSHPSGSTGCTPRPLHIGRHQIRHPIPTTVDLVSRYRRLLSRSGPTSSSSRCSRRHELLRCGRLSTLRLLRRRRLSTHERLRRRRTSAHELLRRRRLSTHIRLRGRRLSTPSHQLTLSLALTPHLGCRPTLRSVASSSSTIPVDMRI